jgi:hypothetical protein
VAAEATSTTHQIPIRQETDMKKTLLIGLAFILGTWAASYLGNTQPKVETQIQPATAQVASR